ncbi:ArsR/SmtB family transcription factor [Microbacterium aurum]
MAASPKDTEQHGTTAVATVAGHEPAVAARLFKSLGDPIRVKLLTLVRRSADGEACFCDLAEEFDFAQSTLSHHLRILRRRRGALAHPPRTVELVPRRARSPRRNGADSARRWPITCEPKQQLRRLTPSGSCPSEVRQPFLDRRVGTPQDRESVDPARSPSRACRRSLGAWHRFGDRVRRHRATGDTAVDDPGGDRRVWVRR